MSTQRREGSRVRRKREEADLSEEDIPSAKVSVRMKTEDEAEELAKAQKKIEKGQAAITPNKRTPDEDLEIAIAAPEGTYPVNTILNENTVLQPASEPILQPENNDKPKLYTAEEIGVADFAEDIKSWMGKVAGTTDESIAALQKLRTMEELNKELNSITAEGRSKYTDLKSRLTELFKITKSTLYTADTSYFETVINSVKDIEDPEPALKAAGEDQKRNMLRLQVLMASFLNGKISASRYQAELRVVQDNIHYTSETAFTTIWKIITMPFGLVWCIIRKFIGFITGAGKRSLWDSFKQFFNYFREYKTMALLSGITFGTFIYTCYSMHAWLGTYETFYGILQNLSFQLGQLYDAESHNIVVTVADVAGQMSGSYLQKAGWQAAAGLLKSVGFMRNAQEAFGGNISDILKKYELILGGNKYDLMSTCYQQSTIGSTLPNYVQSAVSTLGSFLKTVTGGALTLGAATSDEGLIRGGIRGAVSTLSGAFALKSGEDRSMALLNVFTSNLPEKYKMVTKQVGVNCGYLTCERYDTVQERVPVMPMYDPTQPIDPSRITKTNMVISNIKHALYGNEVNPFTVVQTCAQHLDFTAKLTAYTAGMFTFTKIVSQLTGWPTFSEFLAQADQKQLDDLDEKFRHFVKAVQKTNDEKPVAIRHLSATAAQKLPVTTAEMLAFTKEVSHTVPHKMSTTGRYRKPYSRYTRRRRRPSRPA